MSQKLTKRQIRSLKAANAKKEQRLSLKATEVQRRQERAARRRAPPRQRDWWDGDEDGDQPDGSVRRVPRPRASHQETSEPDTAGVLVGTVVEVRSADSLVMYEGQTVRAILPAGARGVEPGMRSPIAVGDTVTLEPIGSGEARIVAVAPRRSALTRDVYDPSRKTTTHKGQALAVNIDQGIIVCSPAEPPFRPRLLDRYLVAASRDSISAVICLNKTDLGVPDSVERSLNGYAALGVRVIRASATANRGIEELQACIAGSVSLLTGHSGVGKSSLLNALEPGLSLRIGDVTQSTGGQGKGRHTTSSARLIPLSTPNTFVVDTPGIRAFGIRDLEARDLAQHCADISQLAPEYAYRDCLHRREPGCAVEEAAAGSHFLQERLKSYRIMLAALK